MKNKVVVWFVLAALLVSLVPVSVFAAEPMELKVFVRNSTGGVVDLRLTDANGDFHYMTLDPGVYEVELMEGKYEYYAVTTCGVQVGVWNLNVSKELMISCDGGMLSMDLSKRCDNNWWGVMYYLPDYDFWVYNGKDSVNLYDWLLEDGMPEGSNLVRGSKVCWSDVMNRFQGYPLDWRDSGVWFIGSDL